MNLKPCPFCGETEELYPGFKWPGTGRSIDIHCLGCGVMVEPSPPEDARIAWNRRGESRTDLKQDA